MATKNVVTVRIPDDLSERLEALADQTHRQKAFYVREALKAHLDELEWAYGIAAVAESIRAGVAEAHPTQALIDDLGFDADDLRAEGRADLDADR